MNFRKKRSAAGKVLMLNPADIRIGVRVRKNFDEDKLAELAESIKRNGMIQPLVIRRSGEVYELVAGERRLKAAIMLGLCEVPCIEIEADGKRLQLVTLIENLQREGLSFFETAAGFSRLITEFGFTQQEIAIQLGLAQSTVANKIRLLRLTASQRESIENMQLTERHARALLRICDDSVRTQVLNEVIVKGYNVEETERYIDRLLAPKKEQRQNKFIVKDIQLFVNSINKAIDVMKVSGIDAKSERSETDQFIKYTVIIPKRRSAPSNGKAV